MAKITFFISIVFLSSHLSEQTNLSLQDNLVVERKEFSRTFKVSSGQVDQTFDARDHWPYCTTIGEVHDQVVPFMDTAYATTGAFADRICIATNGRYNKPLSVEDLISCSGKNFSNFVPEHRALEFFKLHGVVSGGKYNSNDGCQPLRDPPIFEVRKYHNKHKCVRQCYGDKSIDYNQDHVKIKKWYYVKGKNKVAAIQKEVLAHGPVVVSFLMEDDFFYYTSGIYKKSPKSKYARASYAKLIGWGVDNGVPYWLLVNSMGHEWGENGLFRIKRGTNECRIETWVTGVVPDIK